MDGQRDQPRDEGTGLADAEVASVAAEAPVDVVAPIQEPVAVPPLVTAPTPARRSAIRPRTRPGTVSHGARWTLRGLVVAVLFPLIFVAALPLLLIGQEITAPSWIRERVEQAGADALGGGSLRFAAITVTMGSDLHPRVRLLDATVRDADGRMLARVPEVSAILSPRGLLFERSVLVQEVVLSGAELSVSRARDGSIDMVADDGPTTSAPVEGTPTALADRAATLAAIPDRFDRLFEIPALAALRSVQVQGLVVNYDDARAGRTWTLDGGEMMLDLSGGMTSLRGDVSLLSGRDSVARATLRYESPRGSLAAQIGVTLVDVAASDLASQSAALTWLSVVDAPISVALRVALDENGDLGPLDVALKMADGQLRPVRGAPGVDFDLARAYLSYDPAARAVRFDTVEVRSDWGGLDAQGVAYLREVENGLPRVLLGQFALSDIAIAPPGAYDAPVRFPEASAQFRLRLDPFRVDIAELSLSDQPSADGTGDTGHDAGRLEVVGGVAARPEGWEVSLDARLPAMAEDRVMALWPVALRPGLRGWFAENLTAGRFHDVVGALRLAPGSAPVVAVSAEFADATLRPLPSHPPFTAAAGRITWEAGALAVALDRGRMAAPLGGSLDLAGTTFAIPAGGDARPPAVVGVAADGPIIAALSLLDLPPYGYLTAAGQPVTLAEGNAEVRGEVDLRLGGPMLPGELDFDMAATLTDVSTDVLIPDKVLTADALDVAVTPEGIEIAGPVRLGGLSADGSWSQGFAPEERGRSEIAARVAVDEEALTELGIVLPPGSVAGAGTGDLTMRFAAGDSPRFDFDSTLEGVSLSLPQVGWAKSRGRAADLTVSGRLSTPPVIDSIALTAPGLSAEGSVSLTAAGALNRLPLRRVRIGDWLDASVTLVGRGSATPGIVVEGGRLDLGAATFGTGGSGEGGPIEVALDRVEIIDGIALTGLRASLDTTSGIEGTFSGRVNDGPAVTGRVAPIGNRVGARVEGNDAGAVLRAAGFFEMAEGGSLDLLLLPLGEESYEGELTVGGLMVRDAPVLASLLNAVSVVGLLQQLDGQGILFDEVLADFRIDPTRVTVSGASAVGAGLGLSMDGSYDTDARRMNFQGVVSPFYLINGIGEGLTRRGEGVLGFNYTLEGSPESPQVGVNPLSILTPGAIRDIFRQPPQG